MKVDLFTIIDGFLEQTPDSMWVFDLTGKFLRVSRKKAENHGFDDPKKMIGKMFCDFMKPEEAAQVREDMAEILKTGKKITDKIQRLERDGQTIYYSVSMFPIFGDNKKMVAFGGTSRDITERVIQEQKNAAMSEQIVNMVKIVSHDLSSPLINISTIAKRILNGRFGEISPEVYEAVTEIFKRLLKQRGAVLDYLYRFSNLKCEDQEIEKEELDLRSDVIDEVLEELDEMIQDNKSVIDDKLGLIPAGAVKMISNKEILKIVYRNLLTNALKHGGSGCTISFGFEEFSDHFEFNVFDDGPPVPDDEVADLFEPFVQGKNVVKGNGLGIGLNTIRNMIRNLDGELWYKTTWSKHPNFIFKLMK